MKRLIIAAGIEKIQKKTIKVKSSFAEKIHNLSKHGVPIGTDEDEFGLMVEEIINDDLVTNQGVDISVDFDPNKIVLKEESDGSMFGFSRADITIPFKVIDNDNGEKIGGGSAKIVLEEGVRSEGDAPDEGTGEYEEWVSFEYKIK